MIIEKASALKGTVLIPGDKSITHRAVMLGALAEGKTVIHNYLDCCDTRATIGALRAMGIDISEHEDNDGSGTKSLYIYGKGLHGLQKPSAPLNLENSGTSMRLLAGILAASDFTCTLTGDESLRNRPMDRIIKPLRQMGAKISSYNDSGCAPLTITGRSLKGIQHVNSLNSGQVKAALLFAGLYAGGKTTVYETRCTRNHTELLLDRFGAPVSSTHIDAPGGRNFGDSSEITACERLKAQELYVPGDFSSAAFFIAAALLVPGSDIFLPNIGVNTTRIGFLNAVIQMGGDIEISNLREISGERIADLRIRHSRLRALNIPAAAIPSMIDEIPLLALIATQAKGTTTIKGLSDLRHKESDRLRLIYSNFVNMGASVNLEGDTLFINGPRSLIGTLVNNSGDHRIAMTMTVAGLISEKGLVVPGESRQGYMEVIDTDCVSISFPTFYDELFKILM